MQRTRRVILDYLKRNPGASLGELARAAGVAEITTRAHVAILTDDGLLRATEVRHGRGRPARHYFLTEAAEAHFPKHYDQLAANLLAGVAQLSGPELMGTLIGHLAADMAGTYRSRVEGKPLAERVAAIAGIIEEQGGAADWQQTETGYVVREHNCPYLSVSRCDDQICELDRQVVAKLADAVVEVPTRLRDGADNCSFVITANEVQGP
jgi:predicted ArsR family transcriptional regulator